MTKIRSQITREILQIVQEADECHEEDIDKGVDLDRDTLQEYVSILIDEGFLKEHHSKARYELTDKGEAMMRAFGKLDDITSISIVL